MADTTVTTEDKRNELREKIEAAEARNAERSFADYAADVKDGATQFVKDHPIATVAGGLAIGMLLAGMTKPGRRVRRRAGAQASSLWSTVTELAAAYGTGLLDTFPGVIIAHTVLAAPYRIGSPAVPVPVATT